MSVNKVSSTDGSLSPISGGTLYTDAPVGTLYPLMSAAIPENFILCDGTAYSATDYPELWAILPATVKDTTNNTFTIDLREATVKGAGLTGNTVGAHYDTDGLSLGEFIDDRVQAHEHTYLSASSGSISGVYGSGGGSWRSTSNMTGRTGDTTEVKAVGVNWIIKAKSAALPTDFANAIKLNVLWRNPSPSAEFAAQTITLNSDDYDMYEVVTSEGTVYKALKGNRVITQYATWSSGSPIVCQRDVQNPTSTTLAVGAAQTHAGAVINGLLKPVLVIGYKLSE